MPEDFRPKPIFYNQRFSLFDYLPYLIRDTDRASVYSIVVGGGPCGWTDHFVVTQDQPNTLYANAPGLEHWQQVARDILEERHIKECDEDKLAFVETILSNFIQERWLNEAESMVRILNKRTSFSYLKK